MVVLPYWDIRYKPDIRRVIESLTYLDRWQANSSIFRSVVLSKEDIATAFIHGVESINEILLDVEKSVGDPLLDPIRYFGVARDELSSAANLPLSTSVCYWRALVEAVRHQAIEYLKRNHDSPKSIGTVENFLYMYKIFEELARMPLREYEVKNPIHYSSVIAHLVDVYSGVDCKFFEREVITQKSILYNKLYGWFKRGLIVSYGGYSFASEQTSVMDMPLLSRCGNDENNPMLFGPALATHEKYKGKLKEMTAYPLYVAHEDIRTNMAHFVTRYRGGLSVFCIDVDTFENFVDVIREWKHEWFTPEKWDNLTHADMFALANIWARYVLEECGYRYGDSLSVSI